MPIRAILLDVEGTTTPVDFVYRVLFPHARMHLRDFLLRFHEREDGRADLTSLEREHRGEMDAPAWRDDTLDARLDSAVRYAYWLMDRDRKSTALKSLQGKIWEEGYRTGELRGQIYPDVSAALTRWRSEGKKIAIFSSGSVLAQKLLFANSTAGDLTPFIGAHFDTTKGPKHEAPSYVRIGQALDLPLSSILFLSDVAGELDAARVAGMATSLCVRPGAEAPADTSYPVIRNFDEVRF